MRPRPGAQGRPRLILAAALSLVALVAATPVALAQLAPGVNVEPSTTQIQVGPDDEIPVEWRIENTGDLAGTVTLDWTVPDGWRATLTGVPSSFSLDAGATRAVSGTITPEPAGDTSPADGDWTLTATLVDDFGRSASDSAATTLTFDAPPPPAPAPPAPDRTLEYALAGFGVVFAALLAGLYVWQLGGIELEVERARREVDLGAHTIAQVTVRNRRPWERRIDLRLAELPAKWGGAFSARSVAVARGKEELAPMFLRLPFDDAPGMDRRIELQARPNRWSPWRTFDAIHITTADARPPLLVRSPRMSNGTPSEKGVRLVPAP